MKRNVVISVIVAVLLIASIVVYGQSGTISSCQERPTIETLELNEVPQSEVWDRVKTATGEGYELFSFGLTLDGNVNIHAVRHFVCSTSTVTVEG